MNKTKFFNIFRKILTIPIFEKIFLFFLLKRPRLIFLDKLIPPAVLYKKESMRIINRIGIKYRLDISDYVDHFFYFGYEDESYYLTILKDIREANVILDIGANIGITSLFFASLNSKGKIYAFEPHPDTFQRLVENIQINNFENIRTYPMGAGSKNETRILDEVDNHNSGMNRIIGIDSGISSGKKITTIALDTFFLPGDIPKVDFIKIDVEGFETEVLKGAKEIIRLHKPVLFIELDDNNLRDHGSSAEDLIVFLENLGYEKIYRSDNFESVYAGLNVIDFTNCHFDIIAKA